MVLVQRRAHRSGPRECEDVPRATSAADGEARVDDPREAQHCARKRPKRWPQRRDGEREGRAAGEDRSEAGKEGSRAGWKAGRSNDPAAHGQGRSEKRNDEARELSSAWTREGDILA